MPKVSFGRLALLAFVGLIIAYTANVVGLALLYVILPIETWSTWS